VSQENVEIVRNLMEARFRGDLGTVFNFFDPEVEFRPPPEFPAFEVCHGLDEMSRSFGLWIGAWESLRYDSPEYVDAGDRVIAMHRQWGKGKSTGAEVQTEVFNVFTLSGGKVLRYEMFFNRREAFDAVGLSA
jgi:ketosteroid isomerase-like protein